MKKKNTRKIGEDYCKEAIEICQKYGHKCDGPFHKVQFVHGRMRKVHNDIFGVFDFISVDPLGQIFLHQVTSSNMKSNKVKKINSSGIKGVLWTYGHVCGGTIGPFRIYQVFPENVLELEIEDGRFIEK